MLLRASRLPCDGSLCRSLSHLLGGHWTFSSVVVHAVVGDSSQLPAAVVFIVDVVCHILQVLHVSSGDKINGVRFERLNGAVIDR